MTDNGSSKHVKYVMRKRSGGGDRVRELSPPANHMLTHLSTTTKQDIDALS